MAINRRSYASLDIAKFIAAILVILLHLAPGLGLFNTFISRLAVPFFLVTAGYFLFRKMPDSLQPAVMRNYAGRVLRLYLVWTVLYYIGLPLLTPPYNREDIAFLTHPAEVLYRVLVTGSWSVLWYLIALLWAVLLCWACLRLGFGVRGTLAVSGIFYLIGLLGQAYSPLLSALPGVQTCLHVFLDPLGGSRTGLFFAFFYFALGLALSRAKPLPRSKCLAGLLISLSALLAEVLLLQQLASAAGLDDLHPDFYLFTAPVTWFLFSLLLQIGGESRPVHQRLRSMSTLLYCSHILIWRGTGFLCWVLGLTLDGWPLFFTIFLLSMAFSVIITILAQYKPLRILRWLY